MEIIIELNNSADAKIFNEANLIHRKEFKKVLELINEQLNNIKASQYEDNSKKYQHDTITILGTRGSGKTTFLLSLLNHFESQHKHRDDIEVLDIIDPTLIEEKGHIFLNIISRINALVNKELDKCECDPTKQVFLRKKEWRSCLEKLAHGLPNLDGIGSDLTENKWQDAEFIMDKGILHIQASNNLKVNFQKLIKKSLEIMNKKCFIIAFDDIDIDFKKGWPLLETIRKYFTSQNVITILSGDMKLYSKAIRKKQWDNLGESLLINEAYIQGKIDSYNELVTEIEGQYMQKVMKPIRRIYLSTLYEKIYSLENEFVYRINNSDKDEIVSFYNKILGKFGIRNSYQAETYRSFLLDLPLRTQIQFLSEFEFGNWELKNINITDAFLSDLFDKHVNVNLANSSPKLLNVIILKLLLQEKVLGDAYQLQPITTDLSLNSSLIALSFLFSSQSINKPEIIFEYMIKIGYVHNLFHSLGYLDNTNGNNSQITPSIEGLCKHSSIFQDKGLRDIVGYMIAYFRGSMNEAEKSKQSNGIIPIQLSFNSNDSNEQKSDKIDFVLRDKSLIQQTIGFIPLSISKSSTKNRSFACYSVYSLIATIGELIRIKRDANLPKGLMELSQIRSYPMPEFKNAISISTTDDNNTDFDESKIVGKIDILESLINVWIDKYTEIRNVSPHLLGKISTRFFYALGNIEDYNSFSSLGQIMHAEIIAILNAILIEDVRENSIKMDNFNINNTNFSDNIFVNNINAVSDLSQEQKDNLFFSKWMISCPLFLAYIRPDQLDQPDQPKTLKSIIKFCDLNDLHKIVEISIYELLKNVSLKNQPITISKSDTESFLEFAKKHPYKWFTDQPREEFNKLIKEKADGLFGEGRVFSRKILAFHRYLIKHPEIKWQ